MNARAVRAAAAGAPVPSTLPISRCVEAAAAIFLAAIVAAGMPTQAAAQVLDATPGAGDLGLRGNDEAQTFRDEPPVAPPAGSPGGTNPVAAPTPPQAENNPPSIEPNYGRPRKLIKQYGPRKTVNPRPLPPLQPYQTAPEVRAAERKGGPPVTPVNPPAPTVALVPQPPPLRKSIVDPNPFAPVGIDVGFLRVTPYIEGDIGYDSNPEQANTGVKGSAYSRVEGGAAFQSEWSNHELKGNLRAGYSDYFSDHNANRPDADGKVDGRIDVTRDTKIDLEGRFTVTTQRPSSPELAPGIPGAAVVGRPLIYGFGGTAGVTQTFNRLSLSLLSTVDRTAYENANLSDGSILRLDRDNYNAYGLRGRASYEITPGLIPFLEAFGDIRRHDVTPDLSGFVRNSTGAGALGGSSFEFSRKLTGQASLGYEDRSYDDKRLKDLRGPVVDGSLVWSPTALTTLTLRAATSFDETDIAGASGSISRRVSLEASHALFRNVTLTGLASFQDTNYTGIKLDEKTYDLGLKAEYSLSRWWVLRASYTLEHLKSTTPGSDYTQNVFLLGLRLQR